MKNNPLLGLVILGCLLGSCKEDRSTNASLLDSDFEKLNDSKKWKCVFQDNGTEDWTTNWTLDGLVAQVENTEKGIHFSAGPEARNDAHHAVLWTKESFVGNLKIEYDYTRTDSENQWVNILYIQATGNTKNGFPLDISKWSAFREVPAMKTYFENMNALHISYAAFNNTGDGSYYVRARQYPKPEDKPFDVTKIYPSYDQKGFFKSGQTYHITVLKTKKQLFFKMEGDDEEELFTWDLSEATPVTEGRIGLRHMYTRSAIYKNIKIYSKK